MDNFVILGVIVTQLGLMIVTCIVGAATVAYSETQSICKRIFLAQAITLIISSIVMMWISIIK